MLTQVGRYEIKQELGRGGMATVYRGYDPLFQRDVAVKVVIPEFLSDPHFRLRFEREAQTIAALEHPAIVPVYDFGEQDGQPYLVMRFLAGGPLTSRLRGGRLPFAEIVRVLNRLAPALDEAHQQGVVHRDLKPDNILFDQRDQPFITDFGIAKLTVASKSLTTAFAIIGTPAYMSPEQAQGSKQIDGRSDIYALGVMVFEMLTGRLPFDADTPVGVVMKHITEPPPLICEVDPSLPPHCTLVLERALAKNPADRFATASELAQSLADAAVAQALPPLPKREPVSQPTVPITGARIFHCPNCNTVLPAGLPAGQPFVCAGCGARFALTESGTALRFVCPSCGAPNPYSSNFCASCKHPLKIDCVQCHAKNPADATNCFNCGLNLAGARARRSEVLESRRKVQQERDEAFKAKLARQQHEKLQQLIGNLADPANQEFAIYQLTQMGEEAALSLLAALVDPDKPQVRYAAARVLGQICGQHELKALVRAKLGRAFLQALDDPEPGVRRAAAAALGLFKGAQGQLAVEPLGRLLKDRNEAVREQARASLQKIGGERAQSLLDSASSAGVMGWLKR